MIELKTKKARAGALKSSTILYSAAGTLEIFWGKEHADLRYRLQQLADELREAGVEP